MVLGIVAIIDGGKRGDAAERLRGIVGVTLGVSLPLVVAATVLVLSHTVTNTPPTADTGV